MLEASLRKELVIQTENRVGLLAEMARLLSEMGINILAVTVETRDGGATIRLIPDAQLYARDALRKAGFPVEEREVVIVNLHNRRPGFLCRVVEALAREEIDIEDLYTTASEGNPKRLVVFTCSNNGKAAIMLRGH